MATANRTYASLGGAWKEVSKRFVSVGGEWVPREPPPDPWVEDGSFSALDYLRQNPTTDLNWSDWSGDGSGTAPDTTLVWDADRDALILTINRTFTTGSLIGLGDFASAGWPDGGTMAHPIASPPGPATHPMVRVESRWASNVPGWQLDLGYPSIYWSPAILSDWGYWGMLTGTSVDVPNLGSGPAPAGYWTMFIWSGNNVQIRAQEIEITGLRTSFLKPAPESR